MGAVYEAVHVDIGKLVAVKVLLPEALARREVVTRFQLEAQAAAASGHRGVVDIYDVGTFEDGAPYLVMEYLRGESLRERTAAAPEGVIPLDLAAYVACQVLSALSAVHSAGIVHRDLKPENIFLVDTGAALPEVKLLDFGISRVLEPGGPEHVSRMTASGVVMGTPSFMSPEQAMGERDIDHRTDLFSMGVILYECLTGELPFTGDNYNALMTRIINTPARRPSELRPGISPEVERIIVRSMEKDRAERFASAGEMFHELLQFVDQGTRSLIPVPADQGGLPRPSQDQLSTQPGLVPATMVGAAPAALGWR